MAVTDYITAAQLRTAVASVLKISEVDLPQWWDSVTTQAANFAEQEIKGKLLARGYDLLVPGSNLDITHWDRNYEFSRDLGVWKSLILGGAYQSVPPDILAALDRRQELRDVVVTVAGLWVKPSGDKPDLVRTGRLGLTDGGIFSFDEDDDPHYGIQW